MIARKSAFIIFIQLINGLLGFVALKFVALYMEPWEYGIVGFAYGFIALFSIFGKLGYDVVLVPLQLSKLFLLDYLQELYFYQFLYGIMFLEGDSKHHYMKMQFF